MRLQADDDGLWLRAWVPDPHPTRIPDAPPGSRVADLWRYDVVECFLVGEKGHYLEAEIGPGGHFLVLSFEAPRKCSGVHLSLQPELEHDRTPEGWSAGIRLDWALVPPGLCALNAFVCARGRFLAYHPVPGDEPDFHQPDSYPAARLARD